MSRRRSHLQEDCAAYSASQPLFDVLRLAVSRVETQRRKLEEAMNEVKAIHVKLRVESSRDGIMSEAYSKHALEAWCTTTESYSYVFDEMRKLTMAIPEEGRLQKPGHQQLHEMHQLTRKAHLQARTLLSQQTTPPTVQLKRELEVDEETCEPNAKRFRGQTVQEDQHKRSLASDDPSERPQKRARSESSVEGELRPEELGSASDDGGIKLDATHVDGADQEYAVQYEDVSAEVEARLKLKEVRRKETKGETKRKWSARDSLDQAAIHNLATTKDSKGPKRARTGEGG